MKKMTMKERMLAVLQGKEMDQVPFAQYSNLAGPDEDIWKVIGQENMGILARGSGVVRRITPNCRIEEKEVLIDGKRGRRRTLYTPAGSLYEEHIRLSDTIGLKASARHKYYIKEPEDYKILLAYLRDMSFYKDTGKWINTYKAIGDNGLVFTNSFMKSSYQTLWIQWVSMEDMAFHMHDYPELMEEVLHTLQELQFKAFNIICEAAKEVPMPFISITDNITGPMIGSTNFQKYCMPVYEKLAELLEKAHLDIPVLVHMDGGLKPLWEDIARSKINMIDSFTPAPDNDTTVADAIKLWPKIKLGLNFPSSIHLAEPEVIYETTMQILKEAGHTGRLQIQISENVPPETWRKSFPHIVKAIKDFGPV